MDPSDLTSLSELNRAWASLSLKTFNNPDPHMERLWGMAERDSWSPLSMNWDAVQLDSLPLDLRQGIANMVTQLHYGEVTALLCAARLVQQAPDLSAKLFSSSQVGDEARHVQWFSRLMQKLECDGRVQDTVTAFMTDVYECESIDGLVIGMHILVEGMAHSLFSEGGRFFNKLGPAAMLSKPYRGAKKVFGEWLPNFLGKDESRHIAYGVHFLQQRLPGLTVAQRDALENQVNRWGEMFSEAVMDPDLVLVPGLDGQQVTARCIKDLNHRLASIGLYARIPTAGEIYQKGETCGLNDIV